MQLIKYIIPLILFTLLVILASFQLPWFFLLLLASFLLFNKQLGVFNEAELRLELRKFYTNKNISQLKVVSGLLIAGYNMYILFLIYSGSLSLLNIIFLAIATGIANGCFLLTLAHDLSHSNSFFKKCLSDGMAMLVGMPFFRNDHEYGHHELIGTDQDNGSAELNQTCYHFVLKSFTQRLWRSYHTHSDISKEYKLIALKENYFNTMLLCLFVILLIYVSFYVFIFWLAQSLVAIFAYEVINYIQHYGLNRTEEEDIELYHSWNSYYKFSNYLLWFLPIHSAHHVGTPIYQLKSVMGPSLPYPFFKMFVMALYPKWWFKVMNPLVHHYNK